MGGIFRLLSNGHAIIEISPNSISFVSFLCFRKSLVDLWAFDEKNWDVSQVDMASGILGKQHNGSLFPLGVSHLYIVLKKLLPHVSQHNSDENSPLECNYLKPHPVLNTDRIDHPGTISATV